MAKYERSLFGDIADFVSHLDREILEGSMSATFEDGSDVQAGEARIVVRVYERYAASSGNRVSLNVTCVGWGNQIWVTAITSGASQAMFLKLFTLGEESFLDVAAAAIDAYAGSSDLR